uniref:Origin recognition complex subunit 5 n=1 Tax=Rhabditophanes sp. KR3021 TaxID=114890 RepID=A0AC35U9I7_9BILA
MEKIKSVKEFAKFLETSIFKKPVDRVIFILRNAEAITDFKIDFVTSLFAINDYLGDKIVLFVTLSSRKWTCILSEFKHLGTMPQNVDLFRAEKTKIRDHLSETILEKESPRRREMFLNGFIETAWLIVNNDDQLRLLCHKSYELFNCSKTKNSREVCNIVKDVINNTYKTPNSGLNDDKIELPTIAKYCIIAAYCASFNPPTSDKQFFSCENHKQKKTNLTIKKEIDLKLQEQGPKLFTEDRFRMIFYNLISRDESIDASQIGSQQTLETLCNVALLARSAKQTNFKSPKYRSVTSFEFTSKLAESVDLDLKQCMYAYNS